MPKAIRIDAVRPDQTGSVTVEYSKGAGPLPPPGGQALTYSSMAALFEAVKEFEESLPDEHLVFMALASWIKSDPQMATPGLARNKAAQLDLTGSSVVVKVG